VTRVHRAITSWLWGRAAILAVAVAVGWITGSFFTGLVVAFIAFGGFFLSSFLYLGGIEWRLGRRFRAPHGRVTVSRSVAESGAPILFVVHRASGDWVFAESRVDAEREGATALHIQQVLELDISVGAIGGLPPGSAAVRDAPGSLEWETQPVETVTRG
jgi:hypothetical protein